MTTKGYAFYKSIEYREKMRNIKLKGNIQKDKGYILIYLPNHPFRNKQGYVYEHRRVMENHIGRFLTSIERIHHKNGIRHDNRIKNLVLFRSTSEHAKSHFPKGSHFGKNCLDCYRMN